MSLTIEIPEDLKQALIEEAEKLGLSVSDYAIHILETARAMARQPRNGAELVAYWKREGLIGSRPEISDSQAHARQIRARAEQRFRE